MYFIIISTSKSGPTLVCFVHVDLEMCFASQRRALFFLSTSKSAPRMVCFVRFDFEMCFAPLRRKLFEHLNFQNCSEGNVFFCILTSNCARATTACAFSTCQLPKVLQEWCVLYVLTSKCASRHSGVHFSISHLARWLRTRRFGECTFRPSGATSIGKTQCFTTFLPFRAPASSFL